MSWFKHLKKIRRHKRMVMRYCFKVGLYKQGLLHDMSKYSPTEFLAGAKYYQGYRSPNDAEREDKGYSAAWLHHKGRNKHHLEYWTDYSLKEGEIIAGVEIPTKYVVEMFCDRIAASRNYNGERYTDADPYNYYMKSKSHYIIHEKTAALLEEMLIMLKEHGEIYTFDYIRRNILHNKN